MFDLEEKRDIHISSQVCPSPPSFFASVPICSSVLCSLRTCKELVCFNGDATEIYNNPQLKQCNTLNKKQIFFFFLDSSSTDWLWNTTLFYQTRLMEKWLCCQAIPSTASYLFHLSSLKFLSFTLTVSVSHMGAEFDSLFSISLFLSPGLIEMRGSSPGGERECIISRTHRTNEFHRCPS